MTELEKMIEEKADQLVDQEMTQLFESVVKSAFKAGATFLATDLKALAQVPEVKRVIRLLVGYNSVTDSYHECAGIIDECETCCVRESAATALKPFEHIEGEE